MATMANTSQHPNALDRNGISRNLNFYKEWGWHWCDNCKLVQQRTFQPYSLEKLCEDKIILKVICKDMDKVGLLPLPNTLIEKLRLKIPYYDIRLYFEMKECSQQERM